MINILSFSTNPEILPVMDRLVNKNPNWRSLSAANLATARKLVQEEDVDLVLLGAGTGEAERSVLQEDILFHNKQTRLINHYGGGSGLLLAEVTGAMTVVKKE
ncbi:MAG: hypothetical protein AAGA31_05190 [Bacteroidota bacterium]